MKRVLILGCGGAGKSTVARQLNQHLHLGIISLDAHYWQSGWQESSKAVWEEKVLELIKAEQWIMDGNYSGTLEIRAQRADTLIFLDFNRWTCLWGIFKRWLKYYGTTRPEMAPGCPEQLNLEFFWYVWTYRQKRQPAMLVKLANYRKQSKRVYIFTKRKQVKEWLRNSSHE